ncbi:MAG TPA: signal peptide peptidase SppA [candidate division Zixibacteria bacterium]|nr:signal peptide peptidase SppA [candidate division Zixibacteria bacterium]
MKKALIIIAVVLIVVFAVVLVAMRSMKAFTGRTAASIDKPSVLSIDLSREYPERSTFDFSRFNFSMKRETNFLGLIKAVEEAGRDDKIRAISLKIDGVGLSSSQFDEFAKAIDGFKESGKPVYAFMPSAGMGDLRAGCLADSLFMSPVSDFMLMGMAIMPMFFAGTAEKLGVGFDIIQMGEYKGVGEMFTEKALTEPLRENYTSLLDALFDGWLDFVSARRGISSEDLARYVDMGTFDAVDGFGMGLIDGIVYPQEYRERILSLVEDDDDRIVSISRYHSLKKPLSGKRKIAVIYCLGNIHSGKSQDSPFSRSFSIGDETFTKAIGDAADDDDIEAILLRVDSPGGSALASDFIWKSILDARKKKPVLVSMGGVAASGGYYISMGADSIFCEQNTITGSIGVVFMKIHAQGLMEKVGITVDGITRGEFADDFAIHKPMDAHAYEAFTRMSEKTYEIFTTKAAEGRGMAHEELLAVAGGRIWTGNQAVEAGLVDRIASFSEAIDATAKMVDIPRNELGIITYPREKGFWEIAFELRANPPLSSVLPEPIEKAISPVIDMITLFRPNEILALMPVVVITDR